MKILRLLKCTQPYMLRPSCPRRSSDREKLKMWPSTVPLTTVLCAQVNRSPLIVPRISTVRPQANRSPFTTPSTRTVSPLASKVSSTFSFAATVTFLPCLCFKPKLGTDNASITISRLTPLATFVDAEQRILSCHRWLGVALRAQPQATEQNKSRDTDQGCRHLHCDSCRCESCQTRECAHQQHRGEQSENSRRARGEAPIRGRQCYSHRHLYETDSPSTCRRTG